MKPYKNVGKRFPRPARRRGPGRRGSKYDEFVNGLLAAVENAGEGSGVVEEFEGSAESPAVDAAAKYLAGIRTRVRTLTQRGDERLVALAEAGLRLSLYIAEGADETSAAVAAVAVESSSDDDDDEVEEDDEGEEESTEE